MKVRNGFVSNSSSSSFLIRLRDSNKDYESIKNQLFSDLNDDSIIDYNITVKEIVDRVCSDLKMQVPVNTDVIYDFLQDVYGCDIKSNEKIVRIINRIENDKNHEKCFYIIDYSDNNGELETVIEHGNIFRNIQNFRLSLH